jgi:hypothetical protein
MGFLEFKGNCATSTQAKPSSKKRVLSSYFGAMTIFLSGVQNHHLSPLR